MIATTPQPPYYAVIFLSTMSTKQKNYAEMSERMIEFASKEEGFLGIESARDENGFGITISYWESEAAIQRWKDNAFHFVAQEKGKSTWYTDYMIRICEVERAYGTDRK